MYLYLCMFYSSDVFDVYRPAKDRVVLLDFNPFGETTESLLFSWSEMRRHSEEEGQGLSRARISGFENLLACEISYV